MFAFYGRKKKLLAVLMMLLAAEFSAMITLVVTSLPKEVAKPNPIPHIHAAPCVGISQPRIMSSLWCVNGARLLYPSIEHVGTKGFPL